MLNEVVWELEGYSSLWLLTLVSGGELQKTRSAAAKLVNFRRKADEFSAPLIVNWLPLGRLSWFWPRHVFRYLSEIGHNLINMIYKALSL